VIAQEQLLQDLVIDLAEARAIQRELQATLDSRKAEFEKANRDLLETVATNKATVSGLEAEIRTAGSALVAKTGAVPCLGTKVRSEKAFVYRAPHPVTGELMAMDRPVVTQLVLGEILRHGWTSMLKPDQAAFEKTLKGLPEEEWPTGVSLEVQTVLSIDSDLSPLLVMRMAAQLGTAGADDVFPEEEGVGPF
jgi:hypothetical protein